LHAAEYDDVDNPHMLVQPDAVDINMAVKTGDGTDDVGGTLTITLPSAAADYRGDHPGPAERLNQPLDEGPPHTPWS
jgi:hypothetical protein